MVSNIPLVTYWFGLWADLYSDNFKPLYIYLFILYFQISNFLVLTHLVFMQFQTFVCLNFFNLTYLLCLCQVWRFDILNTLILPCLAFIQFRTFAYSNVLIFIFLFRTLYIFTFRPVFSLTSCLSLSFRSHSKIS